MKNRLIIIVAVILTMIAIPLARFLVLGSGSSRFRAEHDHGISLPASARNIQCRGDAWVGFLDRGAVTLFEMASGELGSFLSQVRVTSRSAPALPGPGDPCVGGWNVWPVGSPTACPGNPEYCGFTNTWQGTTVPSEMMSCASPVGDSLHIEVWGVVPTGLVIKLCTDWN